jgi:hypothetical protein
MLVQALHVIGQNDMCQEIYEEAISIATGPKGDLNDITFIHNTANRFLRHQDFEHAQSLNKQCLITAGALGLMSDNKRRLYLKVKALEGKILGGFIARA